MSNKMSNNHLPQIIPKFKKRHFLLVIIFSLGIFEEAVSQKINRFDGIITLAENITGIASYDFKTVKSDTLYHGKFEFESIPFSTEDGTLNTQSISGGFENGKKTGSWLYHTKSLLPKAHIEIKNYLITNKTNGLDYLNLLSFEDGKAHGKWVAIQRSISDSKITDTTLLIQTNVSNGVFEGNYRAESDKYNVIGEIKNGYLDDVWKIVVNLENNQKLVDIRMYEKGNLKAHRIILGQDTTEILHFELEHKNPIEEKIPINEAYFELLDYVFNTKEKTTTIDLLNNIDRANELMQSSFRDLSYFENIHVWSLANGSEPVMLPFATVYKYPFSMLEKSISQQAEKTIRQITEVIDQFMNNPQVKISRFSSEEIALDAEIMNIFKNKTALIAAAFSNFKNPAFEYINREDYLKLIVPNIEYPVAVTAKQNGDEISMNYVFPVLNTDEEEFLLVLNNHLNAILDHVQDLQLKGMNALGKVKSLNLLEEREAEAVALKDTVLSRFNNQSKRDDFNNFHAQIAKNIVKLSDDQFSIYANVPEETQLEMINDLIACHEQMRLDYTLLGELPAKLKSLDDLYIRSVWNPYTFTYMDERVKERLYKLFENQQLPFLINNIAISNDCLELKKNTEELFSVVDIMFDIRIKDTREMEKAIRKTSTTQESIAIMKNVSK